MARSPAKDLASETDFVKSIDEEGRKAPLAGGAHYVTWGAVIGIAAFLSWLRSANVLELPGFVGGLWFWFAALAIGCGLSFLFARKFIAKPGGLAVGAMTEMSMWFSAGIFMIVFLLSITVLHDNFEAAGIKPYALFWMVLPVAFGVCGLSFHAIAIAARLDWMRGFAAAAWIFSAASLYYLGDAKQLLAASAGSVICAVFPGLILIRLGAGDSA